MADTLESKRFSSYFDPAPPAPPEDILGVPSEALIELGRAAGLLALRTSSNGFSWGYNAAYRLEPALQVFGLAQRWQMGQNLTPKDARPYRQPVKKLVPKAGTASAMTAAASGLFIGIPARIIVNRQIEKRTLKQLPEAMAAAESYVRQIEPAVNFLASFERPREEFLREIGIVAGGIRELSAAKANGEPVTADNIGWAVSFTAERLMTNRLHSHLPMLSRAAALGLRSEQLEPGKIAVVAPEILESLDSVLPKDQSLSDLIDSAYEYPAWRRGLAKTFRGASMDAVAQNGPRLLPAIRDVLPETGDEAWASFERAKKFLAIS